MADKITTSTPLKEFPRIYNADRQALIKRIEELEKINEKAREEYTKQIEDMRVRFNKLASQLINQLDQKLDEFENKFVTIDEVGNSDSD